MMILPWILVLVLECFFFARNVSANACPIEIFKTNSESVCLKTPRTMYPNLYCRSAVANEALTVINDFCSKIMVNTYKSGLCIKFLVDDAKGYGMNQRLRNLCFITNNLSKRQISSLLIHSGQIALTKVFAGKKTVLPLTEIKFIDSENGTVVKTYLELYLMDDNNNEHLIQSTEESWIQFKNGQMIMNPKAEDLGDYRFRLYGKTFEKNSEFYEFKLKVEKPLPIDLFPIELSGIPGVWECKQFPIKVFSSLMPYEVSDLEFNYTCAVYNLCNFYAESQEFCYATTFSETPENLITNFTLQNKRTLQTVRFEFRVDLKMVPSRLILTKNAIKLRFKVERSAIKFDVTEKIKMLIAQLFNRPQDRFFTFSIKMNPMNPDSYMLLEIALVYLNNGNPTLQNKYDWLSQVAVHNIDQPGQQELLELCDSSILESICEKVTSNSQIFGHYKFIDCQLQEIQESICMSLDDFKSKKYDLVPNLINWIVVERGFPFEGKIHFERKNISLNRIYFMELLNKNRISMEANKTWISINRNTGHINGLFVDKITQPKNFSFYLRYQSVSDRKTFISPFTITVVPWKIEESVSNNQIILRLILNCNFELSTVYKFVKIINQFLETSCSYPCNGATRLEEIDKERDNQIVAKFSWSEFYNTEKTSISECPREQNKLIEAKLLSNSLAMDQWRQTTRELNYQLESIGRSTAGMIKKRGNCLFESTNHLTGDDKSELVIPFPSGKKFTHDLTTTIPNINNSKSQVFYRDSPLKDDFWMRINKEGHIQALVPINEIFDNMHQFTVKSPPSTRKEFTMKLLRTEEKFPPINHKFTWEFAYYRSRNLNLRLKFWDALVAFLDKTFNVTQSDVIITDWIVDKDGYSVSWALESLWKKLKRTRRTIQRTSESCVYQMEHYLTAMMEPTKDGPLLSITKRFSEEGLGLLRRVYFQPFGVCVKSSSYSNSGPDQGPKIYLPPDKDYPSQSSASPNGLTAHKGPSTSQQGREQLLKIVLPILVIALLLFLIGLMLLWLLKLRKKYMDGKSAKCQALTSLPSCLFCERMSKCFKSAKTRPDSNEDSQKTPLRPNDMSKPSLANEVCYDDGTHQRSNEMAQHQCQVYSQDHSPQPAAAASSSSYIMPKSEYFNKPNPYRNMPPMIDNQFNQKRPIGL